MMLLRCAACRRLFRAEDLDAKPDPKDKHPGETDREAAERGVSFERLECRECYGPNWSPL
jgi:hypothetical protein